MTRFLKPAHILGLAFVLALTWMIYIYWPWPLFALRMHLPAVHKMFVLPVIRDYQGIIAYLVPFIILSVANAVWSQVADKLKAMKSGS